MSAQVPPPYPGYTQQRTNGKAIASLVVALVSFFVCTLGGVLAVILGRSAKQEIRASQGVEGGEGLATAGEIVGWIEIGLTVLGVVVFFLVIAGLILLGNETKNVFCNISEGLGGA